MFEFCKKKDTSPARPPTLLVHCQHCPLARCLSATRRDQGRVSKPLPPIPRESRCSPEASDGCRCSPGQNSPGTEPANPERPSPLSDVLPVATSTPKSDPPTLPTVEDMNSTSNAKVTNDANMAELLTNAKKLGLPVVVVNVTNNCSSPNSSPAKVDASLPDAHSALHLRLNEQNGEHVPPPSTALGCTPAQNDTAHLPVDSALLRTPSRHGLTIPSGAGYIPPSQNTYHGSPGNSRRNEAASTLDGLSFLPSPSIDLPSLSALSLDMDDDVFDERKILPTRYLLLLSSTTEAIIRVSSASQSAMSRYHVDERRVAYLRTCKAITDALGRLKVTLSSRDDALEDEHRVLGTGWYIKFVAKLNSLERTLKGLSVTADIIEQRLCSTAPHKPPTLSTFERLNARLKEYAVKLENLQAKFDSAFNQMESSLLHPQLDEARANTERARLDYGNAGERYHSARAREMRLQNSISSRRSGRRASLRS